MWTTFMLSYHLKMTLSHQHHPLCTAAFSFDPPFFSESALWLQMA